MRTVAFIVALLGFSTPVSVAQQNGGMPPAAAATPNTAGQAVFDRVCSQCHTPGGAAGDRAPRVEILREFPPERILDALVSGKMQSIGASLSETERRDVSEWLAGRRISAAGSTPTAGNQCSGAKPMVSGAAWNGWSPDSSNSRFQPAKEAGLSAADVPKLKLKWAFAFPNGAQVSSQPTIVGGRLFMGSDSGQLYSLDASTGCVHWTFKADATIRNAPVLAPLDGASGPLTVFVGDLRGKLYAVDATSGKMVWSAPLDEMPSVRITAAPAIHGNTLYAGVSSGEEGSLNRRGYECCRFRGSVSALDSATGKIVWKTYTVDEPKPIYEPKPGENRSRGWGPSGGSVWSTPTVDPKRNRVYITTGNAYSGEAGRLNDAVVALDMATGKVVWAHQDTPRDVWLAGCTDGKPGCAEKVGPDWDFSSSAMLKTLPGGREILVAAHKGGVAIALDPDREGALVWRTDLFEKPPSFFGDVLYGGASDSTKAYFALQESDAVTALNLRDGSKAWSRSFRPSGAERVAGALGVRRRAGFGAAVSAIPGVIFCGGWDGVFHALSAEDGRELWNFNTATTFETVNGVKAKGGSMGGPGSTIVNGTVYVGSGYVGVSGGMPGNVLLAFAVN